VRRRPDPRWASNRATSVRPVSISEPGRRDWLGPRRAGIRSFESAAKGRAGWHVGLMDPQPGGFSGEIIVRGFSR